MRELQCPHAIILMHPVFCLVCTQIKHGKYVLFSSQQISIEPCARVQVDNDIFCNRNFRRKKQKTFDVYIIIIIINAPQHLGN